MYGIVREGRLHLKGEKKYESERRGDVNRRTAVA